MDQVGRDTQVLLQVTVFLDEPEDPGSGEVAVFPDQGVDAGILSELAHAGRQHDQLPAVGDGHARAVDRLVSQPRALELPRVQEDHDLLEWLVEELDIHLPGKCGRLREDLPVIADEKPLQRETSVRLAPDDREHVHDGQAGGECRSRVVQDGTHRRVGAPHHPLHAVDGAQVVALVDRLRAAGPDEDVLHVAGHADDLVRDNLPDGEDQVVASPGDQAIHLGRPVESEGSLGDLADEVRWHAPQGFQVLLPAMDTEELRRHTAEHPVPLFSRYLEMGSRGGKHVGQGCAVVLPGELGDPPGT